MKALVHACAAYAFCACVAGCAAPGASSIATTGAAPIVAKTISADDAKNAITIGNSTKADVMAALGKTMAIGFDSGFEVWVYQYPGDTPAKASGVERTERAASGNGTPGKTEFVVLFAPSGVVAKTRIRPAPPPAIAAGRRQ